MRGTGKATSQRRCSEIRMPPGRASSSSSSPVPAADVERCRPLLDNIGQQTFVIGTDPGHANLIKLLGNMMTATALEMLGEVVAVTLKRGLDPKPFIDILTSTMFGGRVHKIYGDKIIRQSYAPGFVMPLALKDVRLALAEAESAGAPMPSVSVVRDRLITGIARGYAGLDWTALGLVAAEEAGLHVAPSVATMLRRPSQLKHLAASTQGRMEVMTRQAEALEINMELADIPGHIAQGVARRNRHLGHWRVDVGRNR